MTIASLDQAQTPAGFKLLTLQGRLSRSRYILACLGATFAVFIVMLVLKSLMMLFGRFGMMVTYTIGVILYFAVLPAMIAMLSVRRAHDFNLGGWMALLILLPLFSPWFAPAPLVFWLVPGSRADNQYGPRPYEKPAVQGLAVALPLLLLALFFASVKPQLARQSAPTGSTSTLKQYKP